MSRGRLWPLLAVGDGTWGLTLLHWHLGLPLCQEKKSMLAEKLDQCMLQRKLYRP